MRTRRKLAIGPKWPAHDRDLDQPGAAALQVRGDRGAGLGADGEAIACILEIAAGHDRAIGKAEGRADMKARIGGIGRQRRCPRCLQQFGSAYIVIHGRTTFQRTPSGAPFIR